MKNMKLFVPIALMLLMMSSCTSEPASKEKPKAWEQPKKEEVKVGQEFEISTEYGGTTFASAEEKELLKELNICDDVVPEGCLKCATCTPKFFRFFDINRKGKLGDLFALQIRAEAILKGQEFELPTRHFMIFAKDGEQLVKVNGYRGYLIKRIVSESGVDDIIIRFFIPEDNNHFHCLFKWNGSQYDYISCEKLYQSGKGGPVLPEHKEDVSKQVYTDLMMHNMIL